MDRLGLENILISLLYPDLIYKIVPFESAVSPFVIGTKTKIINLTINILIQCYLLVQNPPCYLFDSIGYDEERLKRVRN